MIIDAEKLLDESEAYRRGYDCGVNGANTENCHFAIFSTHKKMKEWERGKADADKHGNRQTPNPD